MLAPTQRHDGGRDTRMLTSKLGTAGRPARSIATIKKLVLTTQCLQLKWPALGPQGRANNNLQLSETQKVSTRRALQFPQAAGGCHIKPAISHKLCCHRSIPRSLGGPCQLESCAAGKRTSGSTVVCAAYKRPGAAV